MKVKCNECGFIVTGTTQEELVAHGWCGGEASLNGRTVKFAFCPKCYTPEKVVKLIAEGVGHGTAKA